MTDEGSKWSWAAYLGASWTWCIGMFLPVLLIRDYGPWAWLIFAVPNAVGAAAMGWVMRSASMSYDYAIRHASACRLFSFVTIAFQLFFSIWMLPRLVGPIGYVGVAILIQSAFTPLTRSSWLRVCGWIALAISVVMAAGMQHEHALHWPVGQPLHAGDAVGLALVCLAGFLTCPYLDLTFHRARQSTTDNGAKFAFGIGFCLLFASMIVLTFFYAADVRRIGLNASTLMSQTAMAVLAVHWLTQMTYTVHVHAAELARQSQSRDDAGVMRAGLGLWLAIGLAAGMAATAGGGTQAEPFARTIGESAYRLFMSFYGLLFPAYVLLAIGRANVRRIVWLATAAVASPFYWLAFLQGRMSWAIAGVGVILVGAVIGRSVKRPVPDAPIG